MKTTSRDLFFFRRNPINSRSEAIKITDAGFGRGFYLSALVASGFRRITDNSSVELFLPCPLGTFSNYSSQGLEGCIQCPPGTCRFEILQLFVSVYSVMPCSKKHFKGRCWATSQCVINNARRYWRERMLNMQRKLY